MLNTEKLSRHEANFKHHAQNFCNFSAYFTNLVQLMRKVCWVKPRDDSRRVPDPTLRCFPALGRPWLEADDVLKPRYKASGSCFCIQAQLEEKPLSPMKNRFSQNWAKLRQFWEFTLESLLHQANIHLFNPTHLEAPLQLQPGIPLVVDADNAHEV